MDAISKLLAKTIIGTHAAVYRLTGGRLGAKLMGQKVLLLTTTGAQTERERTVPLTYFFDSGDVILTASNGGRPTNPGWYHNLTRRPNATIQIGTDVIDVTAEEAEPDDRAALWGKLTGNQPGFAAYAKKTDRTIPMMRLHLHN